MGNSSEEIKTREDMAAIRAKQQLRAERSLSRRERNALKCRQLQHEIDTMRLPGPQALTGDALQRVRDEIRFRIGARRQVLVDSQEIVHVDKPATDR